MRFVAEQRPQLLRAMMSAKECVRVAARAAKSLQAQAAKLPDDANGYADLVVDDAADVEHATTAARRKLEWIERNCFTQGERSVFVSASANTSGASGHATPVHRSTSH
jgi:NADPH-dependent ferric siderophore reductase